MRQGGCAELFLEKMALNLKTRARGMNEQKKKHEKFINYDQDPLKPLKSTKKRNISIKNR